MPRIAIRADGDSGQEAGMGHVVRSMAYVSELVRQDPSIEPFFVMKDYPEGIARAEREGHPVLRLPLQPAPTDYRDALAACHPALVIIDTLGSTPEFIAACRNAGSRIVTVDDLAPSALSSDAIVNGILWATSRWEESPGRPKIYQGVEYLQLRPQFAEANRQPRTISRTVAEIVISTGGADGRGFAAELAAVASRLSFPCHVKVMIGPAYGDLTALRHVVDRSPERVRFTLVQQADNMADYLVAADLALVTAGTVMFESAACGTPAVILSSYQNQAPQAQWFHQNGIALHLGYVAGHVDPVGTLAALEELAADFSRRQEMSSLGRKAVDGRGLERFVAIVRSELAGGLG